MPTKSTRSPGAMTSRMPLFLQARSWDLLGRREETLSGSDDVAARFLVRVELDEAFLFCFFEKVGEGTEAIIRLVEPRVAALERLLDHRAPDLFLGAALGHERFQRSEHQIEALLLLVLAGAGGRGLPALAGGTARLLVLAHQVVVVDELVAVGDQQVGAGILDADADHRLRAVSYTHLTLPTSDLV